MSSLYRKVSQARWQTAIVLVAFGTSAGAAEIDFIPKMDMSVEVNSNRELVTSGPTHVSEGYVGDIGGILNYLTPDSTTIFHPEVGYSAYPVADEDDFYATADLYSSYKTQRSDLEILGRFDRRGTYDSELAPATFNTVNPNQPTAPETGRITTNSNRTLGTFAPNYTYDLTPRLAVGAGAVVQDVNYTGDNAHSYVPYDYYLGSVSVGWAATRQLDTKVTAFGTHESAKDGSGSVNGGGVTVGFDYKWSNTFSSHFEVVGERDDSDTIRPILAREQTTNGGATFSTTWKGEISRLMLTAGRTFTPSGAGGKFALDQIQVEYHRELTPRWRITAAGIYNKYSGVTQVFEGNDYTYVNAELAVTWRWTRTWYLEGGVQYLFDKYGGPDTSASNNMLYVEFGYRGLKFNQ